MPKFPTFPTLYNEALQISISKLKEWDYLNPEQTKSATLTWSRNGNQTGSISIKVNANSEQPYIELDYKYRDEPRTYKVSLVSMPSNLGKGLIWNFLCPQTNKRCRILYSIGGYFLHREAFKSGMYEKQTYSKKTRQLIKLYECIEADEALQSIYYKKYAKTHYRGALTKKMQKLMHLSRLSKGIYKEDLMAGIIR